MVQLIQRAPLVALLASAIASGQTVLHIDARAPVPAPLENHTQMGTAVSPSGEAGIDIVASYVMWNYHENKEGHFDWKGDRDLRRFVRLAAKAGLDVVVCVGPWVHAEVRYGGIPDWVVDAMPTRADDPQYLGYVERLYRQIGAQLKGQLRKEGGPVLGVQIENEYNNTGSGEGAQHISTLKRLARAAEPDRAVRFEPELVEGGIATNGGNDGFSVFVEGRFVFCDSLLRGNDVVEGLS